MSLERLFVVIMAGGKGTRMWPLSRPERPKQFLTLAGNRSLLQQTWDRVARLVPASRIIVVGNETHADLIRDQLPELRSDNLILEPLGRSTAPCLQLAAHLINDRTASSIVAAVASDHLIPDPNAWLDAISKAAEHAAAFDRITCIGITPDSPEPRFGYMVTGSRYPSEAAEVYGVDRFLEKPDRETLEELMRSGRLLRNVGVVVAPVQRLLDEIRLHLPELSASVKPSVLGNPMMLREAYETLAPVSIDYGVLQRSVHVSVVHADISRIDVGNLGSLADILDLDDHENAVEGHCISLNSRDNIVLSGSATVALVGVDNLIVIVDDENILVCDRHSTQDIREVQNAINERDNG